MFYHTHARPIYNLILMVCIAYYFYCCAEPGDELDQTYQVLKEANVLKKPAGGGSSGGSGGSGNGQYGSCQTLHSQHEMTPARLVGRSNPSVNIIPGPGPGSSGHNTPAGPGHPMSVAAAPASGKQINFTFRDSSMERINCSRILISCFVLFVV